MKQQLSLSTAWSDDKMLKRVFSWLTRIGAGPKFGSRPIGPIKINISPEVREFNEAVEQADVLTDYTFDQETAEVLLQALELPQFYPHNVHALKVAMANMAVKR